MPKFHRVVAAGCAASLSIFLSSNVHAVPVTFSHAHLNTDWTSAGVGGIGTGSGTITIAGVTGSVTRAYLYWHGMDNAGDGVYDNPSVTLNSAPVTGTSIGDASTNCWGTGSSRAFVADVTAIVTGNGGYTVASLASAAGDNANGASLVVVFDDGNAANNRDIVFFEGNDSNFPESFPGEDMGWHATLGGIDYQGGAANAQVHLADGQRFDTGGLDDNSLTFTSSAGAVTIADAGGLYDGESVPNAGTGRAPNGALWDIHMYDIASAFGAPGMYTLRMDGQDEFNDCLGLALLLIDLEAGSVTCGNGIVDDGEACDPTATEQGCTEPRFCLSTCQCSCLGSGDCVDKDPCTADICNVERGVCEHPDICTSTTTTTTTTLPPTQACCLPGSPSTTILTRGTSPGGCIDTTAIDCLKGFNGSPQGPGTNCDQPGICSVTSTTVPPTTSTTTTTLTTCGDGLVLGDEQCDDGDNDSGDGCSSTCEVEECWVCDTPPSSTTTLGVRNARGGGPSACTPDDGAPCDDEDLCTVNDVCALGVCGGTAVLIGAACDWVIVGGDPDRDIKVRSAGGSEITGNTCGDRVSLGKNGIEDGDVVAMRAMGAKVLGIGMGPDTDITGASVTGGGGIKASPGSALLPGLSANEVAPNSTATGTGGEVYDTTGSHAQVAECNAAQTAIDTAATAIEAAGSTASLGLVQIQGSLTIAPGSPAGVLAGQVNVIDITELRSRVGAQLILDGGGNPATAYVLRVQRRISMLAQTEIVLQGGLTPANVILYNGGRRGCKFGVRMSGFGTVVCPDSVIKLGGAEGADWTGVFLGGRGLVKLGEQVIMTHAAPTGIISLP